MKNQIFSLALIAALAACSGGNPFEEAEETTGEGVTGGETDGNGITTDGVPPGSSSPTPGDAIFRSEERDDGDSSRTLGNGFAKGVSYDSDNDTFTVDNLAFDGDSPYVRGRAVSSLNGGRFNVYEAEELTNDPVTGEAIDQFTYRAIYGQSRNTRTNDAGVTVPNTQFAIVRTGNYVNYGFGGFIYQRDVGVTLPDRFQAAFNGQSAGMRDFAGRGGLEYTTADVRIVIDTDDFDEGAGVDGTIFNRRVLDLAGNDITADVAEGIAPGRSTIPVARFVIGPGVLRESGDLVGEITSQFVNEDGEVAEYESGNYYAVVAGTGPDEIVGIFVLENSVEPNATSTRDTSGFIVYREPSTPTP